MAVAAGELPLPFTVRGPRGWARHGLRPGKEYQVLDADEKVLANVQCAARKQEGFLSLAAVNNSQELLLLLPEPGQAWHLAWSARSLGLDGGEIQRFSASQSPIPDAIPSTSPCIEVDFTGTRVLFAGDSVDKPDPLRPAWRFWIQGARFAEAEAIGQREVRIDAHAAEESRGLPAPLLLAWLLGIVLTEAASA